MGCYFERQKSIRITNAFQKFLDEFNRKSNKTWVDKSSKFYNISMKSWLQDNDIERFSICNERKSVLAERYIRILKSIIYKYMTSVSKSLYIDKLYDIVNKCSNTYISTIRMKPADVKSNTYSDFSVEKNS